MHASPTNSYCWVMYCLIWRTGVPNSGKGPPTLCITLYHPGESSCTPPRKEQALQSSWVTKRPIRQAGLPGLRKEPPGGLRQLVSPCITGEFSLMHAAPKELAYRSRWVMNCQMRKRVVPNSGSQTLRSLRVHLLPCMPACESSCTPSRKNWQYKVAG